MLQSIEVEIDANGRIHSLEPLPAGRRGILTLFEDNVLTMQSQKKQAIEQNPFQDLCGILTAERGVSLADMDQAVLQQARERFDDCN